MKLDRMIVMGIMARSAMCSIAGEQYVEFIDNRTYRKLPASHKGKLANKLPLDLKVTQSKDKVTTSIKYRTGSFILELVLPDSLLTDDAVADLVCQLEKSHAMNYIRRFIVTEDKHVMLEFNDLVLCSREDCKTKLSLITGRVKNTLAFVLDEDKIARFTIPCNIEECGLYLDYITKYLEKCNKDFRGRTTKFLEGLDAFSKRVYLPWLMEPNSKAISEKVLTGLKTLRNLKSGESSGSLYSKYIENKPPKAISKYVQWFRTLSKGDLDKHLNDLDVFKLQRRIKRLHKEVLSVNQYDLLRRILLYYEIEVCFELLVYMDEKKDYSLLAIYNDFYLDFKDFVKVIELDHEKLQLQINEFLITEINQLKK